MKVLIKLMFGFLVLCFIVLLLISSGCAPGIGMDLYTPGNVRHYYYYDYYNRDYYYNYYETFYPWLELSVINGTSYELTVIKNGEVIITILPGQFHKMKIGLLYRGNRSISLVVIAKDIKNKKNVGTAEKNYYLYGNPNEQKAESWVVKNWDIRDP